MKAHRTDLVSFAFGLVFLALSAWWLLAQLLGLALPPVGWFLASALILIGVFGLVGALRSSRPNQPEPTVEAVAPVSGTSVSGAPISGAPVPVSGAATSTSGAALPVWEAEQSSWDTPAPDPTLISDPTYPSDPTLISDRTPATSTSGVPAADAPATDVIHPAWLAHPPSEPRTEPIPDQPHAADEEPTIGIPARPTPSEGNEPTRSDQPGKDAGDQSGEATGYRPDDERDRRERPRGDA